MAPIVFPPELHSMIIGFATYTPVYFDLSPDPRFWPVDHELYSGIATDYATKKALTLVSRQFRSISIPYLYEVVRVHKSSSMHLLADVLDTPSFDTSTSGHGQRNPRKIQYLFVSVLTANDQKGEYAVFSSLERVLRRGGSLQGFGLYDATPFTLYKPYHWMMSIPKGISFLDWKGSVWAINFTKMTDQISESLIALRYSKVVHDDSFLPYVTFPKLTHLSTPEEYEAIGVLFEWTMPSLTHLCMNVSMSDELLTVIDGVANTLRSAILGPRVEPTLFCQIAKIARNLEEYTYHFSPGMERSWEMVGSHQSLQSITVVVPTFTIQASVSTFCNHLRPITKLLFPKLRRVCVLGLDPRHTLSARIKDELSESWGAGIKVKNLVTHDTLRGQYQPLEAWLGRYGCLIRHS